MTEFTGRLIAQPLNMAERSDGKPREPQTNGTFVRLGSEVWVRQSILLTLAAANGRGDANHPCQEGLKA